MWCPGRQYARMVDPCCQGHFICLLMSYACLRLRVGSWESIPRSKAFRLGALFIQVVLFVEKLAHKGELAEAMHVQERISDDGLHLEMLSTALAAGTITRHSAMLLVSAHRRLRRALR